jgi:tRNA threonylcarbamoyladenosine biosynthesis protein TsaE
LRASRAWPLADVAATGRLGAALAKACPWQAPGPRLLFLSGELGTGKTTLVAALLAALGVAEIVRSPSYALIESYALAAGQAVHVDCYRLRDPEEFEQLGLREQLAAQTLLLVEWPEHAGKSLPPPDLGLRLELLGAARRCLAVAHSSAGEAWLGLTEAALACQI